MNMSKDVVLWFDPLLHGGEQLHTARPDVGDAEVAVPQRRPVGHKYIHTSRYRGPLLKTRSTAGKVEGPVAVLGLPARKHKMVSPVELAAQHNLYVLNCYMKTLQISQRYNYN